MNLIEQLQQIPDYCHQRGIVLRTQTISNKTESEIAIVEKLVQEFCGCEVVFSLDALHCQKNSQANHRISS